MRSAQPGNWVAICVIALASWGCTAGTLQSPQWEPTGTPRAATSVDDSIICRGIADHFVGLPTVDSRWVGPKDSAIPSAGRWWVRRCSAKPQGADLEVALNGPGWYSVEQSSSGIVVRQQVPFSLSLQVKGRLREDAKDGVVSLWFVPSAEPNVQVEAPNALEVETVNAWGHLLGWAPGVSPAQTAARRFKQELTRSFLAQTRAGATFTYDLRSGQADVALGHLKPGTTSRPALSDEPTWVINERLVLAPGHVQVLGPLDPGAFTVNVIVEEGPGVTYRAVCQQPLQDNYQTVRDGAFSRLPDSTWLAADTVAGLGERTANLRVGGCKFYLVVTSSAKAYALAALRVRD
jgi:hypothetical protein